MSTMYIYKVRTSLIQTKESMHFLRCILPTPLPPKRSRFLRIKKILLMSLWMYLIIVFYNARLYMCIFHPTCNTVCMFLVSTHNYDSITYLSIKPCDLQSSTRENQHICLYVPYYLKPDTSCKYIVDWHICKCHYNYECKNHEL